jgi:organic radical activating enzyme
MKIKFLKDEDFTNYRKPSMFIGFPYCDFKCNRDSGKEVCQNMSLIKEPNIEIEPDTIVNRYIENSITCAIVMGGLEPFNSYEDLYSLIKRLREKTKDDIVIYTGYYMTEIIDKILKDYGNLNGNRPTNRRNAVGRGSNGGNVAVRRKNSRNRPSEALLNCLRNIAEISDRTRADLNESAFSMPETDLEAEGM